MAEIIITGNLGQDSEPKYTPSGSPKLTFSVADKKSKRKDDGSWEDVSTQWFRCEWWGSMAEHFAADLLKGVRVKVYGTYHDRSYEQNGEQRISKDVKVSAVEILTSLKDRQKLAGQNQQPAQSDPWATPPPPDNGGWPAQDPTF